MVISIFGESCTGKSAIAQLLKNKLNARIFTGSDYKKLAKNEGDAQRVFAEMLRQNENNRDVIVYVISEAGHMPFFRKRLCGY